MVFVGGPRQVGKTTFALSLLGSAADESSPAYLNWDYPLDREAILSARLPARQRLVIFDEIHKYAGSRFPPSAANCRCRNSMARSVTDARYTRPGRSAAPAGRVRLYCFPTMAPAAPQLARPSLRRRLDRSRSCICCSPDRFCSTYCSSHAAAADGGTTTVPT